MKLWKTLRTKAQDAFYGQVPRIAKFVGVVTIWSRKIVAQLLWVGLVALLIELVFGRWAQIIPTVAMIAASMAFTEAQKMRKSFKAWGFEDGPGNVNKN